MPGPGTGCHRVSAPRLTLSVLDLVPVRSDQSTGDALRATLALARTADELGFHRYWVAEHHNMPGVAATNPPVLIALAAGATERMRVGSGGVMLPNHAPLVVAEQFALLEAAFPGRIDLGIGRAPGSDPVTSYALRHGAGGSATRTSTRFPEYVDDLIAMMSPDGVTLSVQGRRYPLRATPAAASVPDPWLLGSSDYSARLAAEKGLPYVFAHHFAGGTAAALELYRSSFQPSPEPPSPGRSSPSMPSWPPRRRRPSGSRCPSCWPCWRCAPASRSARRCWWRRPRSRWSPRRTARSWTRMSELWVIGDPATARAEIDELAASYGVDEVMVHPVAGAFTGTDPDRSPAREGTLRLLAG